jgi:hypothetical protein
MEVRMRMLSGLPSTQRFPQLNVALAAGGNNSQHWWLATQDRAITGALCQVPCSCSRLALECLEGCIALAGLGPYSVAAVMEALYASRDCMHELPAKSVYAQLWH